MKSIIFALCVTYAGVSSAQARVQLLVSDSDKPSAAATVDLSFSFDLTSEFNHEAYRVKVFIPKEPPPPDGYPALYILDGNRLFATYADAMHNESQAREREPAVIVGIESGAGEDGGDRTYDFTATDLTAYEKEISVDLGPNPRFGGYENLLRTIQEEVKPTVAGYAHLDPNRSAIFGWSLGGYFVIHTMLTHPGAFHDYVALSPSLWRSNKALFGEIPGFEQSVKQRGVQANLFLGVGGLEEQLSEGMKLWPIDQNKLALELRYARMVGNARQFADEVKPFFLQNGFRFAYNNFGGDTHNSVPWSAVNPVLQFLFPAKASGKKEEQGH